MIENIKGILLCRNCWYSEMDSTNIGNICPVCNESKLDNKEEVLNKLGLENEKGEEIIMDNRPQLQKKMDDAWDNSIVHTFTTEFQFDKDRLSRQIDTRNASIVYDMEPVYEDVFGITDEYGNYENHREGRDERGIDKYGEIYRVQFFRILRDVSETQGDVYLIKSQVEDWISDMFKILHEAIINDFGKSKRIWWLDKPKTEDIIHTWETPHILNRDNIFKVYWAITPSVRVFNK